MSLIQEEIQQYPAAVVNITNRCTLSCRHCFVFRNGNPNNPEDEMDKETMIGELLKLKKKHGIQYMLWMGGEPLLRQDVLTEGVKLFEGNTITTNGTIDLIDLPNSIYVVSIDGPPEINDHIRGKGAFKRAVSTLKRLPEGFGAQVICQCVVTKENEDSIAFLVDYLRQLNIMGLTFSFYVPSKNDKTGLKWNDLKERDEVVRKVMEIKKKNPDFIRNRGRSLELMLSENAKAITDNCPSKKMVLPLYLEKNEFKIPFCCYGNDVDCDLCGAWVVFHLAAAIEQRGLEKKGE